MTKKKEKTESKIQEEKIAGAIEEKRIGTRGRIFEGKVIRKFPKRVTIEFERMIYVKKYERYAKSRTKIHARLPEILEKEINLGDLIQVQECRPLSKIIHFIVTKKIKEGSIK
ncbi:MAG TPA: 30S ribosomal protein S17 [Candidatus Nanoarchaeia archaeon]|nr:SSU ribosomal protein S17P [uncultured archaeon]HJX49972.1 30S ribosomal protein S17 [Candidatus Nanoarchaeia archaeon]